jgi:hypothetical protein
LEAKDTKEEAPSAPEKKRPLDAQSLEKIIEGEFS